MSPNVTQGIAEAYKSIYSDSTVVQEETVIDEIEEVFEINEENLCESIENYLVIAGFVETKQQAKNMIPHLGEAWFTDIFTTIVISEQIIDCLVEDGYNANEITEEHLYEFCINESADLFEVNVGTLSNLIDKARRTAGNPQIRQAATGLLDIGRTAVTQTAGPILSKTGQRIQSAAQTGQQAVQQAAQAAAQGPKGPYGQALSNVKRGLELVTGLKPGSGSRIRRTGTAIAGWEGAKSLGIPQGVADLVPRIRVNIAPKEEKPNAQPAQPSTPPPSRVQWK